MSYKAQMNGGGESSSGIVPAKQPNEDLGRLKEVVEERPLAKENAEQSNSCRTYGAGACESSGLERVRKLASSVCRQDPRWEPCALGARARFCPGGAE